MRMAKGKLTKGFKENRIARSLEASTVRRIVAIVLLVLILIIAVLGFAGYAYIKTALEPVDPKSEEEVEVEVPIGSTTSSIAALLEENDIIKNGLIFRFYIKFKNESDFQAGNYTFSPSMTINEIIESLKSGKIVLESTHRITIPEGLTVEQIADIYAKHFDFTREEFIDKANDEAYVKQLIKKYPNLLSDEILQEGIRTPLEGYLYGITYDFYEEDPSIETIIEMMLEQTNSIITPYLDQIADLDFTIHETLTFASVVEQESGSLEQRDKISSVFYNRLEEGMKLQTDPTVLYALGEHKDRVLYKDLKVESPYNTYVIDGLPIGPISNFAENSLEAVINPANNNYLYFLHDKKGNIYYAETLDEHNENIDAYME